MRRLVATAAGALVLVVGTPVGAQDGYVGGWTDPAPTGSREGKPLAYLTSPNRLTGEVSHPDGIASVNAFLVPALDGAGDGCEATQDGPMAAGPSGNRVIFHLAATFPCNRVYEVRATAQASSEPRLGASAPPPYVMPLFVAVALPPAPVAVLDAQLEVDGDDRTVALQWPGGPEPDLIGYEIARDSETIGEVPADSPTRFVDDEPPAGTTSSYSVTAVRSGPDDRVDRVSSAPTTVRVDVPGEASADDEEGAPAGDEPPPGGESGSPGLGTDTAPTQARPAGSGISSGPAPSVSPPTTADTGFQETLPFDTSASSEVASPPTGDGAVIEVFEEGDGLDDKQRMAFLAAGLAVLVGAATILTVTRRAAREVY